MSQARIRLLNFFLQISESITYRVQKTFGVAMTFYRDSQFLKKLNCLKKFLFRLKVGLLTFGFGF